MTLSDLLRDTLEVGCDEVWENERIPTPARCSWCDCIWWGCRCGRSSRHWNGSALIASHGAVWNWSHKLSENQSVPPTAVLLRVAVDEKRLKVDGEAKWLYAAIDTDSKLLLEIDVP